MLLPRGHLGGTAGQHPHVYRYLTTTGLTGGTKNAIGNYGGGPQHFYIEPPAGQVFMIERMLIRIEDVGAIDRADEYGTGAAVANGVIVHKEDSAGNVLANLTDGIPPADNGSWGALCYDVLNPFTAPAGDGVLLVRWTFAKGGQPIRLRGAAAGNLAERLTCILEDDFSGTGVGLVGHYFFVQGYRES